MFLIPSLNQHYKTNKFVNHLLNNIYQLVPEVAPEVAAAKGKIQQNRQ